nr:vegetative cell wall protein gp1-like [Aegilops tauschii subsp. strangulata]
MTSTLHQLVTAVQGLHMHQYHQYMAGAYGLPPAAPIATYGHPAPWPFRAHPQAAGPVVAVPDGELQRATTSRRGPVASAGATIGGAPLAPAAVAVPCSRCPVQPPLLPLHPPAPPADAVAPTGAAPAQLEGTLADWPPDPSGPVSALPVATSSVGGWVFAIAGLHHGPQIADSVPQFGGPSGSTGPYPEYPDQAPPSALLRSSEPVRHDAPAQTPPRFSKIDFATYDGTEDPSTGSTSATSSFTGSAPSHRSVPGSPRTTSAAR